jgi:PAS domain S-box-containing protein
MSPPVNKIILFEASAVVILTVGIFVLDMLTPLGWAVWLLYLIPLTLMLQSSSVRDPYYFGAAVTSLTVVGWWVSPPGGQSPMEALINRLMGVGAMWVFTWIMVRQKRARTELARAEAGRSKAETLREAAVMARELAEAGLMGAVQRESQASRELLVSSLRLEGIVQSAMDAILTVDDQQRVLLFNAAAEQMFGCPAKDALGQPLDRFIPPRFRGAHREHIERFGRSGVTNRKMGELGTVMGLRAGGEEFPVEAAISHFTVEGKKFYTVILRDITERKQAERLIRQSEERYRQLISVAPLAIIVNRGNRVIFINDAGVRLFGAVKVEEILGKSPFDLFHPDCHAMIRERIRQLLEGSASVPAAEKKVVTLDGRIVDVEVSVARFTDEEGTSILAVIRDISERNRLQEQLRRTERVAELGTLASGMAHEIGTPMNVILGRAEYLMQRTQEEPVKKGLQTIISQVERITRVMNQLLAFARRKPVERRALDLQKTIDDNLEIFDERLARHRIIVERAFAASCPSVFADADQMSQLVINLVMNAIHAMPDGGTLRVGVLPHNGMVRLTVADTGHGISQDVVDKIFDPFFTTKEFGKGTGLGLTVVKGIIEEHQGTIAVESEAGKGTTFTIDLPVYQADS